MFEKRIQLVQQLLEKHALDALLIENTTNIFYLTKQNLSTGSLLIHQSGAILMVDGRYYESCRQNSTLPVLLKNDQTLEETLTHDKDCVAMRTLAFDQENTSYLSYKKLEAIIQKVNANRQKSTALRLQPVDDLVKEIRAIKDAAEIGLLTEAADLGSKGYDYVCTLLKEGCSEAKIAAELEIFWKRHGSQGLAFDSIIAFGANSSIPHHRAGETLLKDGDVVLIDIGVKYKHYHSDMTRMVFYRKVQPKIAEIYQHVLNAQLAALEICEPGTTISDLDRAARKVIDEAGYGKNFTHSLGHGVGLEIHELPGIRSSPQNDKLILEEGMVITIEPGIYIPDVGGVRIEDTIVITNDGHINLTQVGKEIKIVIY